MSTDCPGVFWYAARMLRRTLLTSLKTLGLSAALLLAGVFTLGLWAKWSSVGEAAELADIVRRAAPRLCALIFGLAPAIPAMRGHMAVALKEDSTRGSASRRTGLLRAGLAA